MSIVNDPFSSATGSELYHFLRCDDAAITAAYRERIARLFQRYEPILDQRFCSEFARQPERRYWELVVAALIEEKTDLKLNWRRQLTKNELTPDFKAEYAGDVVWIEATTTDRGAVDNPDRVPAISIEDEEHLCLSERRELGLRIQSSLSTKAKKLLPLNPEGVNIVAIGGGTIPTVQWNNNIFDWPDIAAFFYPFAPSRLANLDGTPVPVREQEGLPRHNAEVIVKGFASRKIPHEHIAGVLFSTHSIAGLSSDMEPAVYWIENPFCPKAVGLRPAFVSIHRVIVHAKRRQIEYLAPAQSSQPSP